MLLISYSIDSFTDMFLLCVFVCFCAIGLHECSQLDPNFNELRHAKWECDTVCIGSGGKAAFDLKNKICKCTLDKNTDDMERQMILKDAQLLGVPLIITKDVTKRQVNSDSTLGQRAPQRIIITPRTILRTTTWRPFQFTSNRALPTLPRLTTPRININLQQRLEEIRKQITDRRRSRARARAGPHLQQRAGFQEEPRLNVMERLRQLQKERQEKQRLGTAASTSAAPSVAAAAPRVHGSNFHSSPIVGSSRNVANKKSTDGEPKSNGRNSNSEVITQDPSLYDRDD